MHPCATASAFISLAVFTRFSAIKGRARAVDNGYLSKYNAFALIAGKAYFSTKLSTKLPTIDLDAPEFKAFCLINLNPHLVQDLPQK